MALCFRCKSDTFPVVKLVKIWKESDKFVSTCYECKDVIQYGPEYLKEVRELHKKNYGEYFEEHLGGCKTCQKFQFDIAMSLWFETIHIKKK